MPIKNLTEKNRLPRLGKIHLGVKAKNANGVEYPKAVDYFVCPPEVQEVFGEKPTELRILIPIEDEEKWASQYYRCYSMGRGLMCKGDGEKAMRLIDTKTGTMAAKDSIPENMVMAEVNCEGRECPDYGTKCKEIMNLQFLLPEVLGVGVYQIDTSSINSIRNINSTANLINHIYGRISMIPLYLTLEPQEVQTPQKVKKTVYVLNLRTKNTLIDMMQLTAQEKTAALLAMPEIEDAELPIPDDETPELIIPESQDPGRDTPPPPQNEPDISMTAFWTQLKPYGMKNDEVHARLDVTSMKDWVAQGRTLREALGIIKDLAEAEAEVGGE